MCKSFFDALEQADVDSSIDTVTIRKIDLRIGSLSFQPFCLS